MRLKGGSSSNSAAQQLTVTPQSTLHHKSAITNKRATCTYEFAGDASRIRLQLRWTIVTAMGKRTPVGRVSTEHAAGRRHRKDVHPALLRFEKRLRSSDAAQAVRMRAKRLLPLHRRSSFLSATRQVDLTWLYQ